MAKYDHNRIEKDWQKVWNETGIYKVSDDSKKPKFYCLDMFPYPSGAGLHVGHPKGYIATDVFSRVKTHQGYEVLHPMGWDAFGLPAENYAIKNKVHPKAAVEKNVQRFKEQLAILGFNHDWSREINTTDPDFYKWTQWIFVKLFESGLAYQSYEPINWCPSCQTGLSMEDLEDGKCERCGGDVEQKPMRQWVLRITDYADRLLEDLKLVDWEEQIIEQQRNWIGRSEGAKIKFPVVSSLSSLVTNPGISSGPSEGDPRLRKDDTGEYIEVFTTRADTLYGATFMVLAPEHPFVAELLKVKSKNSKDKNLDAVQKYVAETRKKTDLERQQEKQKTGAFTGAYAINPINGEKLPIWISDYVLMGYGTGAIMAVPAHDERDWEFAKKFDLPVRQVIAPYKYDFENPPRKDKSNTVRRVVHVLLENEKGEVLTLHVKGDEWGENKPKTFVIGGIEDGETPEEAAAREIEEETGYTDFEITGLHPVEFHAEFYAAHKDLNRYVKVTCVLARLRSEKQLPVAEKESKLHDLVWVKKEKLPDSVTISDDIYFANDYLEQKNRFTGYGKLINSEGFDGQTSEEAKEKIVTKLAKEGRAEKAVSYKMKDWVFSRQRYWGEPIPIVHCPFCVERSDYKVSLNFRVQFIWDAILDGTKTVESRVLNPEEPERYFGDVNMGDVLRLYNVNKKEEIFVEVTRKDIYKNVSDLYKDQENLQNINSYKTMPKDIKELESRFEETAEGYLEKANQHGIVAWGFRILTRPVAVPESELPLTLPDVESYEPSGNGESPLAAISDWVNTTCPKCGGPAKRETDTMPQWAGSSWYYLRYIDPKNDKALIDPKKEKEWMPVDLYVGGIEHATRHLLYARFWHKFLYDIGTVSTLEPFKKLIHVGLILAEDGRKMSKRWNNVINPDAIVAQYGADSLRVYEMFMGPFTQYIAWNTQGVKGARRFLERVYDLGTKPDWPEISSTTVSVGINKLIKKVEQDVEDFKFNTAIAAFMEFMNLVAEQKSEISRVDFEKFLILLNPFAPHITEELWAGLGNTDSVCLASWPKFDQSLTYNESVNIAVQINGKVRDTLLVSSGTKEVEILALARESDKVAKYLDGKEIRKAVYIPGKILSIVVS